MSSRSGNARWSSLQTFEVDFSNAKWQKITDPKELERIRKLRADLEKYGYIKPRAEEEKPADDTPPPPGPDAT